jgi:hypothetical protein
LYFIPILIVDLADCSALGIKQLHPKFIPEGKNLTLDHTWFHWRFIGYAWMLLSSYMDAKIGRLVTVYLPAFLSSFYKNMRFNAMCSFNFQCFISLHMIIPVRRRQFMHGIGNLTFLSMITRYSMWFNLGERKGSIPC